MITAVPKNAGMHLIKETGTMDDTMKKIKEKGKRYKYSHTFFFILVSFFL